MIMQEGYVNTSSGPSGESIAINVPAGRLNNGIVVQWFNWTVDYSSAPPSPSTPVFKYNGVSFSNLVSGVVRRETEGPEFAVRAGIAYLFGIAPNAGNIVVDPYSYGDLVMLIYSLSGGEVGGTGALDAVNGSSTHSATNDRHGGLSFCMGITASWSSLISPVPTSNTVGTYTSFADGMIIVFLCKSKKAHQKYPATELPVGYTWSTSFGLTIPGFYLDIENSQITTRPPLPVMI